MGKYLEPWTSEPHDVGIRCRDDAFREANGLGLKEISTDIRSSEWPRNQLYYEET